MSYRTIHQKLERFELWLLWLLVAAFFVAVALMFLHATVAMFMVWIGLFVLAVAWVIVKIARVMERKAARTELAGHHCPKCGAAVHHPESASPDWKCDACGASFSSRGVEVLAG